MGHGSTWCAVRDKGMDPCDNGLAGLDTSICTSICCIPGSKASVAPSGNSATKVSPEQLQEGGRKMSRG